MSPAPRRKGPVVTVEAPSGPVVAAAEAPLARMALSTPYAEPARLMKAAVTRRPPAPPVSSRGARTREKLRQAAYQVFRDAGYEATTVDAICEAAAVSKGAFYFHYPAKQDVFLDILDVWSQEIIGQVEAQFTPGGEARDTLAVVHAALIREVNRGRVIVPLWLDFTVHARHDPAIREALAAFYQRGRSAVAEILRPGVPWLAPEALDGLARTVFGAYIGVLIQEIADPTGADAVRAVDAVMGVLRGLVGRGGP
jgi:AcrR family transcriptional regulator